MGPLFFIIFIKDFSGTIKNIVKWTIVWKMELNVNKYKIMHIGINNPEQEYSMFDKLSNKTIPLSKAILNQRSKSIVQHVGLNMWKKSYTSYIRPLIEYAALVWSPYIPNQTLIISKKFKEDLAKFLQGRHVKLDVPN